MPVYSWYIPGIYQEGESVRILETSIEPIGLKRYRVITIFEDESSEGERIGVETIASEIGGGPIQSRAIPDEIVHELIKAGPPYSLTLAEIHRRVGGNPATVNRQARTLATNAPDLQIRLRGWVHSPERALYSLTAAAIRNIEGDRSNTNP